MLCPRCGAALPESAVSCPVCNEPVSAASRPVVYAGFWLRLLAFILDTVLVSIALTPLVAYLFQKAGMIDFASGKTIDPAAMQQFSPTIFLIDAIAFVGTGLYYSLLESSPWQATLGKRAFQLQVTDLEGRPLSFGGATKRYFAKLLSGFTLSIGYIMAGFTEKKQALHDIIVGSLVIRKPQP